MISVEQRFQILAALGQNIDWGSLSTEQVQVGIKEAKRAGREATAFFRNGFRMQISDDFRAMEVLAIEIPALARPSLEELQAQCSWIKSIDRDSSPIEAVKLGLATVLGPDETDAINSAEYERRLTSKLDFILGYQHAKWLVEHQDEFPDFMALLGKVYMDFSGLVVVSGDGGRYVPCLARDDRRWCLDWDWIGSGFDPYGRVAMSSK